MVDVNTVISNNINIRLEKLHKKQTELAAHLGLPRQTVSKMLNGTRVINAGELRRIAEFCDTSMEELTSFPDNMEEMDVFHVFMGRVKTKEAQQSIQDIDALIELLLFHDEVMMNGIAMRKEWTDF